MFIHDYEAPCATLLLNSLERLLLSAPYIPEGVRGASLTGLPLGARMALGKISRPPPPPPSDRNAHLGKSGGSQIGLAGPPGACISGSPESRKSRKCPKTPNLGKIANFGVISPIFTPFREKGQKCPKWPPGGAPREKSDFPAVSLVFLRPRTPKVRFGGEKCDFHPFSPIFMKMGGIHLKSAIFMTFHHLGGKSQEKGAQDLFGYLLCFKTYAQIGVLRSRAGKVRKSSPKSPFRAKAHFWPQSRLFAKKCVLGPKVDFGGSGWKFT